MSDDELKPSLDDLTCWKADLTETVSSELCVACSSGSLFSSLVTVETGDDLANGNEYLVVADASAAIGGCSGNRKSCRLGVNIGTLPVNRKRAYAFSFEACAGGHSTA